MNQEQPVDYITYFAFTGRLPPSPPPPLQTIDGVATNVKIVK